MPNDSTTEGTSSATQDVDDPYLDVALQYAKLGWRVTPFGDGINPHPDDWGERASSEPEELRELFEEHKNAALAVRCGPGSGVMVLDVDRHEEGADGFNTLSELQDELGELPKTARARTGGDGLHYYFEWTDFGRAGMDGLAPGLDLKAGTAEKAAAAFLPPSSREKHEGERYEWVDDPGQVGVAELPESWEGWIREQIESESSVDDDTSRDNFSLPETIPKGERNSTLARFAGRLRNRGFGGTDLLKSLRVVNEKRCHPPLPEPEVERIVKSITSYEPGTDAPIREKVDGYTLTFEPDPGELIGVLTVERGGKVVDTDRLNITSRQRRKAVARAVAESIKELDGSALAEALTNMAGALLERRREAERQKEIERVSEAVEDSPTWSDETRKRANRLLQNDDLLDRAARLMSARGLVGEGTNRRVVFLAAVAGHLGLPIHLVIHGESSGGKNELERRATEPLPEGRVLNLSGLSTHALEYRGGRIEGVLVLDEAEGQADATYELRQAMSEGRVRRLTVNKTDAGKMQSEELEVEVAASVITTTTDPQLHPENQTRVFDLWIDASEEQTRRVLSEKASRAAGNATSEATEETLAVWRCALDSLEPRKVVVPFAEGLAEDFPTSRVRARRDYERCLDLIRAHALLHQRGRETTDGGAVVATAGDYAAVRPLVQAVLGPSMAGLNDRAIEIARVLEDMGGDDTYQKRADLVRECQSTDVASHYTVRKWVDRLHEAGIVEKEKQKRTWYVKLVRDPKTEAVKLPEPEKIAG